MPIDPARLRVVNSHPARQGVVYRISAGLASRGYLSAHLAATYYVPDRFPYRLARRVPGRLGSAIRYQLEKRRDSALPDRLVVDWPWGELLIRAVQSLPGMRPLLVSARAYRIIDWLHDRFAAAWIRRHRQLDAVLAHQGSALYTLQAARKIGVTSVLLVHQPFSEDRILREEHARLGWGMPLSMPARVLREVRAADYVLSASAATTDSVLELGVEAHRIKELPFGIDAPAEPTPRSGRDTVTFLFVGHLSIRKGIHLLRDAFASVDAPGARLVFVGRPASRREARLLEGWNDPRVTILDEVPDIAQIYRAADVFVLPSLLEGFGLVTLEAMAMGLPVVVTERARNVVRHGIDGLVLPPGDAGALAEGLSRLARDSELRARMGESAYQRARQFTWDRFTTEFCGWLTTITGPIRA